VNVEWIEKRLCAHILLGTIGGNTMCSIARTVIAGIAGVTLAAAASLAAHAADISGSWQASVKMSSGQSGSPNFVFKQSGSKLSGTYFGAFGSADVVGSVTGNSVRFSFGIATLQARYVGKISGNTMQGTVDYGGQASGTFTATKQ
jgi:hypothetical protein